AMRLWVFVSQAQKEHTLFGSDAPSHLHVRDEHRLLPTPGRRDTNNEHEQHGANENLRTTVTSHSLSAVLPAYNEEQLIAATLEHVLNVLAVWVKDFEVIVVNDGSTDRTGAILSSFVEAEPRVRVLIHARNQGNGSALADGFAAATKE